MFSLLRIAFRYRKYYLLFFFSACAIVCLTLANSLEIFTLGFITDRGMHSLSRGTFLSDSSLFSRLVHFVENSTHSFLQFFFLEGEVKAIVFFLLFVALFKAISLFAHSHLTSLVAIRISQKLRESYFVHVQGLSLDFYWKYDVGSLSSRIVNDANKISEAINALFINYLQLPFTLFATLFICFSLSWQLSLMSFLTLPLLMAPILFFAVRVKRIAKDLQKNQENTQSLLVDFFSGIQTIKLFCMEAFCIRKYFAINRETARLEEKNSRYDNSSRPILHLIATVLIAGIVLYAFYFAQINIPEILVFCGALHQSYEPVKKFQEANLIIQRGAAAVERMNEVLAISPSIEDMVGAEPLHVFSEEICFENVSFAYQKKNGGESDGQSMVEHWALREMSFSVRKGETIAIVGNTGAGKSTIAQLLVRFFAPQEGRILIDGRPLDSYTLSSLREKIAYVSQRPFLFMDTIASNISCGEQFSLEEVQEASRQSYADEFIQKLPGKYQFFLQERGENLSGGQQQRLSIARALCKKAPIIIMDEATSSLDGESEQYIQKAIQSLHGKVTQIIISHRFSTITHADRIFFIQKGRMIAAGTRAELLAESPSFRQFWNAGSVHLL